PRSAETAACLHSLGGLARDRGDVQGAEAMFREALELNRATNTYSAAEDLEQLALRAFAAGGMPKAESVHREALATPEKIMPGSAALAGSWHGHGQVLRGTGRKAEAAQAFEAALRALEAQRGKLGGSDDVGTSFAARYAAFYHEAAELLVELGRPREAFQVVERSRARGLLAMLAARDLIFSDLPPELDRERRQVAAAYDAAQAGLAQLDPGKDAARIDAGVARLRELHEQRARIEARVRQASPRLGSLQDPHPLDLGQARATLDPGTLLLSYSVGQ